MESLPLCSTYTLHVYGKIEIGLGFEFVVVRGSNSVLRSFCKKCRSQVVLFMRRPAVCTSMCIARFLSPLGLSAQNVSKSVTTAGFKNSWHTYSIDMVHSCNSEVEHLCMDCSTPPTRASCWVRFPLPLSFCSPRRRRSHSSRQTATSLRAHSSRL